MDTVYVKCWKLSQQFPSPTCLLVALAIARKSHERGYCWASQAVIAEDTGLNVRTVRRAISDLEGLGWVDRMENRRDDGARRTDHIWLTLPSVTLDAEVADPDSLSDQAGGMSVRKRARRPGPPDTGAGIYKDEGESEGESEGEGNARETRELAEPEDVDFKMATQGIWMVVGDNGRKRSTKGKVEAALRAAVGRRPDGQSAVDRLELILRGVRAYLADADTRKEGGRFEHGAHRTLEGDRWETFLAEGGAQPAPATVALAAPVDPNVGTLEHPGPVLQRLWTERAYQGLGWDSSQGPRPGMPGCRVSPEIQAEFGFTPYEAPALPDPDADEDSAAW